MENKTLKIRIIIVVIVVVVLALGAYFYRRHPIASSMPHRVAHATVVGFSTVKPAVRHKKVKAIGTASAKRGVMLSADTSGQITEVLVHSGQIVTAGQLLFEINPKKAAAQLHVQQAQLTQDRFNYTRAAALYKKQAVSQSEFDKAKKTYQQDLASVQAAQQQLELKFIRAPFSGRFGLIQKYGGDYVTAGDVLGSLQST